MNMPGSCPIFCGEIFLNDLYDETTYLAALLDIDVAPSDVLMNHANEQWFEDGKEWVRDCGKSQGRSAGDALRAHSGT